VTSLLLAFSALLLGVLLSALQCTHPN